MAIPVGQKNQAVPQGDQGTCDFGQRAECVWKELSEVHVLGVTTADHFTS